MNRSCFGLICCLGLSPALACSSEHESAGSGAGSGGTLSAAGGNPSTSGGASGTDAGSGGGVTAQGSGGRHADGSGGVSANAGGAPEESSGGSQSGAGGAPTSLGPATVWLAGDSTVANGNTPCPVGWGKSFDSLFDERITVVNAAAGGRSVRTWLYDVKDTKDGEGECVLGETNGSLTLQQRWQDMLRDMKEGDFLLIQFGINDGDPNCPRHVGTEAFRVSYRMMAEAARERGAQPVFLTPVSAIACNGSTAVGSRGFLDAVKEEGAALSVPVVDLHEKSVALYDELAFCPVAGGDVSASTMGPVGDFFCDDHTHFDTPGALEIAKLVAHGLTEAGVTLAEYLQ